MGRGEDRRCRSGAVRGIGRAEPVSAGETLKRCASARATAFTFVRACQFSHKGQKEVHSSVVFVTFVVFVASKTQIRHAAMRIMKVNAVALRRRVNCAKSPIDAMAKI